jgi:hypothetical protein
LALAWQGVQSQPDGPDLELRRCDHCGSTLACALGAPQSAQFFAALSDAAEALQRAADAVDDSSVARSAIRRQLSVAQAAVHSAAREGQR